MELNNQFNNNVQWSTVLYFFPFVQKEDFKKIKLTDDKETEKEGIKLNDEMSFILDDRNKNHYRKMIRNDVLNQIKNLDVYKLYNSNDNELKIKSIITEKNKETKEIKYYESNIDKLILLRDIYIYVIDKENCFMVFQCSFDNECNKKPYSIESITNAHIHFVNNYFKNDDKNFIVSNEIKEIEKAEIGDDFKNAYIRFCYGENEYSFSSFALKSNIAFNFENYYMRYLIQMTLFDNKVNKEDLLEKLCGSSIDYSNDKNNTFIQKNRICKSSGFGSVILYSVEEGLTDKFDYELNRYNMNLFHNEYKYHFVLLLNYRIRIEKQLDDIGNIIYDLIDSSEYKKILSNLNEYKLNSAKFYFENVSRLDYINAWYNQLKIGFNVDKLDDELNIKLKYSSEYLNTKMSEAIERENRGLNIFLAIIGPTSNVSLFILALFQVFLAFNNEINGWVIACLIISGVIALFSICFGIFYGIKKRRINKKFQ